MLPSCCTILEEEKLQQEERMRMESRRQVTVSWDSGGSDEAPPKLTIFPVNSLYQFLQNFLFLRPLLAVSQTPSLFALIVT
ncbi:hypothetical protein GDO81_024285 [Engystomops pustulosus]|uniref:Uncharacterized protein n=1 Tax=Engystomops pustulosus TaxID=76066 RepID=A0AAV6YJE2_ENGPU|nr:hypothetical protein GDO81_024285 [Engystomops pustulosus]